jgi:hypothetical protein
MKRIEVIAENKKQEKEIMKIVKDSKQNYDIGARGIIVDYTSSLYNQLSKYIINVDEWE